MLLLLLLSRFSRVRLCATPETAAHEAPPSLGFSRQEHWSGLSFLSPMRESEVAQSSLTLSNPMDCSPPGSSVHRIFQARILEWGAISVLLVKSQIQNPTKQKTSHQMIDPIIVLCLATTFDIVSPLYWVSESCSVVSDSLWPHGLYSPWNSRVLEWVAIPFSRGSSQPRDRTQVSHTVGGFFTSWATREAQKSKMAIKWSFWNPFKQTEFNHFSTCTFQNLTYFTTHLRRLTL